MMLALTNIANNAMNCYKYRRFVTPVTMRVKANKDLNIQLSKGEYRFNIKEFMVKIIKRYVTLQNL